jgi:hypothetical protein
LTVDFRSLQPDIDPKYLLDSDELHNAFPTLEIIDYQEGWSTNDNGHLRSAAGLVARKKID